MVWSMQMIAPVLEELAADYEGKADILKLDVDENPSTAAKYEVMIFEHYCL